MMNSYLIYFQCIINLPATLSPVPCTHLTSFIKEEIVNSGETKALQDPRGR